MFQIRTPRRALALSLFLSLFFGLAPSIGWAQSEGEDGPSEDPPQQIEGPGGVRYSIGDELTVRPTEGEPTSFPIPCSGPARATTTDLLVLCSDGRVFTLSLENPSDPNPTGIKKFDRNATDLYAVKDQVWLEFENGDAGPVTDFIAKVQSAQTAESAAVAETEESTDERADDLEDESDGPAEPKSDPGEDTDEKTADEKTADEKTAGEKPQDEPEERAEAPSDEEGDEGEGPQSEEATPDTAFSGDEKNWRQVKPVGEVVGTGNGYVVIDAGEQDGIEEGQGILFSVTQQRRIDGETVSENEVEAARGRVSVVGANQSRVKLKLNHRAPEGARARIAEIDMDPGTSARRVGGLTVVEGALRPFLPLGNIGIGSLVDARIAYYFDIDFALEWSIAPLGFTVTDNPNDVLSYASNLVASYDSQYVQAGLGMGIAQNRGADEFITVSAVQHARFGSRDGTHFAGTTNFIVSEGDGWQFGGLRLKMLFPMWTVLDRTWGLLRFQSGAPGQTFFEMGLQILVNGNGTEGSTLVTPLVGYGSIQSTSPDKPQHERINYHGPLVGMQLEQRF